MTSGLNKSKEGYYHLSSHIALTSFMCAWTLAKSISTPLESQWSEYHPI